MWSEKSLMAVLPRGSWSSAGAAGIVGILLTFVPLLLGWLVVAMVAGVVLDERASLPLAFVAAMLGSSACVTSG